MRRESKLLLAGDIGATKSHLGIFDPDRGVSAPVYEEILPTASCDGPGELLRSFLSRSGCRAGKASLGVAGPVVGGRATMTNQPWEFSEQSLAAELGLDAVILVNDVIPLAWAIGSLGSSDICVIRQGRPQSEGNLAVLTVGTGLGEAFVTRDRGRYHPYPSEGGYTDFGPTSPLEAELYLALARQWGHVSYSQLCSGSGIPWIYGFLRERSPLLANDAVHRRVAAAADPAPVIVDAALNENTPCPVCRETVELFVRILGAEAGNLALKVLADGGVYLGGGIAPRLIPLLTSELFLNSFSRKGRLSPRLAEMPLIVITRPDASLLGAAVMGLSGETG